MSLFHEELLDFLRRDVKKHFAEEDLSPLLSLEECINKYQYLFTPQESFPIEKILNDAFNPKEFISLGLARYYPRIYRGLPRVYHRNFPLQSRIKSHFAHLPSLKYQAMTRALYSLYAKKVVQGKVTLFSWIPNDECTTAVETSRILRSRLPGVEISVVVLIPQRVKFTFPENITVIRYEEDDSLSFFSEDVLDLFRESDLVLQIPTFYPYTQELIDFLRHPKFVSIGEYGFIESNRFTSPSEAHCLGLHFLEKGILTRKPCHANWDDVQNEQLKRWRNSENQFYLANLSSPMGGAIYLHALLKSLANDERGVDLCVSDLGWLLQFIERQNKIGRPVLEWDLGIRSIEIHFQQYVHSIELASQGKKVRILCPDQISQSDFRALLALSGNWVAVCNDQTFSEVVSQGKAFFYDGKETSRYFVKDLLAIAENRLGGFSGTLACIRGISQSFLYNDPLQEEDWVDETFFQPLEEWTSIALKIGLSLQEPETFVGYTKFNRIITDEFSANSFLCHLVQRALMHRKYPDLEKKENQEISKFISGKQNFAQLIHSEKILLSEF